MKAPGEWANPPREDLVPTMKFRWLRTFATGVSASPVLQQWHNDRSKMAAEGVPASGRWIDIPVEIESMKEESSSVDRAIKNERARIIRLLRSKAEAQTTYEKSEILNRVACELEGTVFVPDDMRGTKKI